MRKGLPRGFESAAYSRQLWQNLLEGTGPILPVVILASMLRRVAGLVFQVMVLVFRIRHDDFKVGDLACVPRSALSKDGSKLKRENCRPFLEQTTDEAI